MIFRWGGEGGGVGGISLELAARSPLVPRIRPNSSRTHQRLGLGQVWNDVSSSSRSHHQLPPPARTAWTAADDSNEQCGFAMATMTSRLEAVGSA